MTRPVFSRRAGASRGPLRSRTLGVPPVLRPLQAGERAVVLVARPGSRADVGRAAGHHGSSRTRQGGRRPLGRTHVGAGAWRLTPGDIRDCGPFGRTLPEGEPHRPRVALRHCSRPRGSLEGWHLLGAAPPGYAPAAQASWWGAEVRVAFQWTRAGNDARRRPLVRTATPRAPALAEGEADTECGCSAKLARIPRNWESQNECSCVLVRRRRPRDLRSFLPRSSATRCSQSLSLRAGGGRKHRRVLPSASCSRHGRAICCTPLRVPGRPLT